ncbi:MAG TPA: hypothetical protein VFA81_10865 [Burkholderiales bacterium]|nr:hypothetical protein [Burkholderiales bacterium]
MKLIIDGNPLEFETPEDAARFFRAYKGAPAQQKITPRPKTNGNSAAMKILQDLRKHAGTEVDGNELAKIIGAASGNGVGPKVYQLRKALEDEDVALDDFLTKRTDSDGSTVWMISAGAS